MIANIFLFGKRWTLLLNVFYDLVVAYPNFHFPPSLPKIFCVVCFEAMPRGILHKKTISPKFNRAKRALGIFKKVRCFVGLPSNVWMWICTADILRLKSMKCYKGILNKKIMMIYRDYMIFSPIYYSRHININSSK